MRKPLLMAMVFLVVGCGAACAAVSAGVGLWFFAREAPLPHRWTASLESADGRRHVLDGGSSVCAADAEEARDLFLDAVECNPNMFDCAAILKMGPTRFTVAETTIQCGWRAPPNAWICTRSIPEASAYCTPPGVQRIAYALPDDNGPKCSLPQPSVRTCFREETPRGEALAGVDVAVSLGLCPADQFEMFGCTVACIETDVPCEE